MYYVTENWEKQKAKMGTRLFMAKVFSAGSIKTQNAGKFMFF